MAKSAELIINVLDYLNKNVNYAVLRNYEGLPYGNNSRDIDIIITKTEFNKHKSHILQVMVDSGWKIVTYLNNGRLISYVCGIIDGNNVELVQWDFFLHTSVRGITLASAEEFLEGRKFNGTLYHVNKEYNFLDKYLYNRAVGAQYPAKYNSTREQVESSDIVSRKLRDIFGSGDTKQIDRMSGKRLLFAALKQNLLANPVKTVCRIIATQCIMWKNAMCASTAPRIGFTGPDGAGKTTVIELMHEKISPVFGKAAEFFHFRPTLFPNLGEAAHSTGIKKEVDREYSRPHRGKKSGVISSFIRLCYYTTDYIIGFWAKVKPHCAVTKWVIFDRYYTDIIADSRRSGIHLNTKFLYFWGKVFIPKLHYNILLTADSDVILARKQELDREGIDTINKKLDYLKDKKGYYLILNNNGAEEAVMKILKVVFEGQHQKNLRRVR